MATLNKNEMTMCAACGKGGDGLKLCNGCKLVRYCGVDCQRAHRPQHKKECKRRAAELHDEELFKQPPSSREECPICYLDLPVEPCLITFRACCSKILCQGCVLALASEKQSDGAPCPFCRTPGVRTLEENIQRIERRVKSNDPEAIAVMGQCYFEGNLFQQDIDKGLECYHRAAKLGSMHANYYIGGAYFHGDIVEIDKNKSRHHWGIAAIAGHVAARHNLGTLEWKDGNHYRAVKHFTISASAGGKESLRMIQVGYRDGLVNKDDFEKTLRTHQKSKDELRSEWRDRAAAAAAHSGGPDQWAFI